LQRPARLDPQLVDERATRLLVRLERLCLAAGAVEGEHQLSARPLPERILGDERLQLRHELRVQAERELRLEPLLERRHAQLLEPGNLILGEAFVAEVGERRPAEEAERLAQLLELTPWGKPLEALQVELALLDDQ